MLITAKLSIDFFQEDEASVILETSLSGEEEKFAEILAFSLFALRQLVCLGPSQLTDMYAALLHSLPAGIDGPGPGEVRLIRYPGVLGRKRFACRLRLDDKNLLFDMDAEGFGALARGVGYYSPMAILAFFKYLLSKRVDDASFCGRLLCAARTCGDLWLERKVNLVNQHLWGLSIATLVPSDYAGQSLAGGPSILDAGDRPTLSDEAPHTTGLSKLTNRPWIPCPQCHGEFSVPEAHNGLEAACPQCGTRVRIAQNRSAPIPQSDAAGTGFQVPAFRVKPAWQLSRGEGTGPPFLLHTPKNPCATTGLCLGIASILLAFIGIIPLLAIIFSGIGLAKASDRNGKGRVQAWIGLILGILYSIGNLHMWGRL